MRKKTVVTVSIVLLALALLFLCFTFWQALEPSLSAVHYLETQGYSSVRILQNIPENRGCSPDDAYRFMFDAIPLEGEKRVEGKVCQDSAGFWYEE